MEFVTISAVNDILLPPFIFIVTFCFLCCQMVEPEKIGKVTTASSSPNEQSNAEKASPISEEIEPIINQAPTPEKAETGKKNELQSSAEEVVNPDEIPIPKEIEKLTKRQARKLMRSLGLQQKRNGIELSSELMVACIKGEFKANPQKVIKAMDQRTEKIAS